jgi:hypothetical protein
MDMPSTKSAAESNQRSIIGRKNSCKQIKPTINSQNNLGMAPKTFLTSILTYLSLFEYT